MKFEGGCYCRKIRYVAEGEPRLKDRTNAEGDWIARCICTGLAASATGSMATSAVSKSSQSDRGIKLGIDLCI